MIGRNEMVVMLFIGVDGGGTRCRARAANADGRIIGEAETGTANLLAGLDQARANIVSAMTGALAAGGLDPSALGRSVAGLGLAGANVVALRRAFMAAGLPVAAFALESDAFVACRGAHDNGDGAIAILGTGTAYVARRDDAFVSLGGWGFALSDQGSGADIGRSALRAALLAYDQIGPADALTEAVLARFRSDRGAIPDAMVEFARDGLPRDFGAFAPLVLDHADDGEPVASAIVDDAVGHIATAINRLRALGAPSVAMLGGLAARYRPRLTGRVTPPLIDPIADALAGALALARDTADRPDACS